MPFSDKLWRLVGAFRNQMTSDADKASVVLQDHADHLLRKVVQDYLMIISTGGCRAGATASVAIAAARRTARAAASCVAAACGDEPRKTATACKG